MRKMTSAECELVEMYLDVGDRGTMSAVKKARLRTGLFPGLEYDDFISVGRIALCEAAMQWDWREGDFGAFAFMRCHFRVIDWIRKVGPSMRARGGTESKPRMTVQTTPWMYSLPDGSLTTAEHRRRRENLPMSQEEKFERSNWLVSMLVHLLDRERLIMFRYYAEGYSDEEIGVELGISTSRVYQMKARSLSKLRALAEKGVIDVLPI